MIIFTNNINILNAIPEKNVFNLSSYYSGYRNITKLATLINYIDPNINQYIYSPNFDIVYAERIFNSNDAFILFMEIMISAYEGIPTIILVEHDEYRDAITESLMKLIEQRYGYNCWLVDEFEDLECVKETTFTPTGLLTLDNDRRKYMLLVSNINGGLGNA